MESGLPGPQAIGAGVITSVTQSSFKAFVKSTAKNSKVRTIILKPGTILKRAFELGKNKSVGSFTTTNRTMSKISSTNDAIEILALKGTSSLRPNRVTTLQVVNQLEAYATLINNSTMKNAFQIVIDPKNLSKLNELPIRRTLK